MSERLGRVYVAIVSLLWWDGPVWPFTHVDLLSTNGWVTCLEMKRSHIVVL